MWNFRLLIIIGILLASNYTLAAQKIIKIGSGSILKGYYSIGLDLCRTITLADKNIKCEVVATSGSVENLSLLKEGKIDFALVQSNIAVEAFEGIGYYSKAKKMQELRQVLNLYDEFFTIVVKDSDKIKVFGDIDGKKISNGPSFSSSNITYDALSKLYNFKKEPIDIEINYENYVKEFCSGKIDVIMMMVGHPNPLVSLIANNCEIDFVTIEDAKIAKVIENNKAFYKVALHKGLYPGISENQNTVAVSAILVTKNTMDSQLLAKFMQIFHKRVKCFRHSSYLLYNLDIQHFTNNFVLPQHQVINQ